MHIGGTNKSGVAANYAWWRLISYDAWGKQLFDQNNTSQTDPLISIGYTGHEHIPAFDLIDMKGRFYDPQLGQMLSPDPIITDFENAQTYNKYSYVFNNPLRYPDPTGYSGGAQGPWDISIEEEKYLMEERERLETEEFLNELRTQGIVIGRELVVDGNEHEQEEQGGGGDGSTAAMWNNLNTGIGAFDVGQGAKGELINYAVKSSPAINDLKYVKGMKVLGGATFVTSSVISGGLAINYYNNGGTNNSVWMKSALDIGMGYVGFLGPIGFGVSATYFLLDAGGAFQGWGDPLTTPKR